MNDELDARLLLFTEQLRVRSDLPVAVEDQRVVVGDAPNCALLFVHAEENKVAVSFHRECHPHSVIIVLLVLLDTNEPDDIKLVDCFLSDVKGVISYESETGFDLLHIQYLRDLLGVRGKNVFTA